MTSYHSYSKTTQGGDIRHLLRDSLRNQHKQVKAATCRPRRRNRASSPSRAIYWSGRRRQSGLEGHLRRAQMEFETRIDSGAAEGSWVVMKPGQTPAPGHEKQRPRSLLPLAQGRHKASGPWAPARPWVAGGTTTHKAAQTATDKSVDHWQPAHQCAQEPGRAQADGSRREASPCRWIPASGGARKTQQSRGNSGTARFTRVMVWPCMGRPEEKPDQSVSLCLFLLLLYRQNWTSGPHLLQ